MATAKYPPLLLKYLKQYQDDPRSRIFAPLAESYRKIGLLNEAIEICMEGLIANPDFVGGKVALARAYADKGLPEKVRDLLLPVVEKAPDNLVAQRLLGEAALALGLLQEALTAFKMLLYFNPHDSEVAGIVNELEDRAFESGAFTPFRCDPARLRRLMKLQKMLTKLEALRSKSPSPPSPND